MIIIKRKGHEEKFNNKKIYRSIYESFLNAHYDERDAKKFAKKIKRELVKKIKTKKKILSSELFKILLHIIVKYDNDVAFLYQTHRDIS